MSDKKDSTDESSENKSVPKVVRTYTTGSGSVYKELSNEKLLRDGIDVGSWVYVSEQLGKTIVSRLGGKNHFRNEKEKQIFIQVARQQNYSSLFGYLFFFSNKQHLKFHYSQKVINAKPGFGGLEDSLGSDDTSDSFGDYKILDADVAKADAALIEKEAPYDAPEAKRPKQIVRSAEEYEQLLRDFNKQQKKETGLFGFLRRKKGKDKKK
jgi:hypothetical protein